MTNEESKVTNNTMENEFGVSTFCKLMGYKGNTGEQEQNSCSLDVVILGLTFTVIIIVLVSLIAVVVKRG